MKLITRDTDYAIRAVCFMAKGRENVVSVFEMAKRLKIPGPFLRKLLQLLNKKGLVASYKGLGGGFRLKSAPGEIFILDIITAFQGPFALCEHAFKKKPCHDAKKCVLKKKLDAIERYIKKELRNITIAQLIRGR